MNFDSRPTAQHFSKFSLLFRMLSPICATPASSTASRLIPHHLDPPLSSSVGLTATARSPVCSSSSDSGSGSSDSDSSSEDSAEETSVGSSRPRTSASLVVDSRGPVESGHGRNEVQSGGAVSPRPEEVSLPIERREKKNYKLKYVVLLFDR